MDRPIGSIWCLLNPSVSDWSLLLLAFDWRIIFHPFEFCECASISWRVLRVGKLSVAFNPIRNFVSFNWSVETIHTQGYLLPLIKVLLILLFFFMVESAIDFILFSFPTVTLCMYSYKGWCPFEGDVIISKSSFVHLCSWGCSLCSPTYAGFPLFCGWDSLIFHRLGWWLCASLKIALLICLFFKQRVLCILGSLELDT